jgi:hypothetical protein
MESEFQKTYRDLDLRMKALAESEGDIYLPNPEPSAPVDYIFVCMEPSLGRWARSVDEANRKIASGFRNFLTGIDPMLLHFSARRYLCAKGQGYYITDFSKGAMLVKHAGKARIDRYDKWYSLLNQEIDLIAKPSARVIAVGSAVAEHLCRKDFPRGIAPQVLLHYSSLASSWRPAFGAIENVSRLACQT